MTVTTVQPSPEMHRRTESPGAEAGRHRGQLDGRAVGAVGQVDRRFAGVAADRRRARPAVALEDDEASVAGDRGVRAEHLADRAGPAPGGAASRLLERRSGRAPTPPRSRSGSARAERRQRTARHCRPLRRLATCSLVMFILAGGNSRTFRRRPSTPISPSVRCLSWGNAFEFVDQTCKRMIGCDAVDLKAQFRRDRGRRRADRDDDGGPSDRALDPDSRPPSRSPAAARRRPATSRPVAATSTVRVGDHVVTSWPASSNALAERVGGAVGLREQDPRRRQPAARSPRREFGRELASRRRRRPGGRPARQHRGGRRADGAEPDAGSARRVADRVGSRPAT